MKVQNKKIVLCNGLRTPIGHVFRSLGRYMPEELMKLVLVEILKRSKLDPKRIDGAVIGWVGQGSHAPNIARVASLEAGLPLETESVTVQANCVSGFESMLSAARRILLGEGELYLAGGTESMSTFPYAIRGDRRVKERRSLDNVRKNWQNLPAHPEIQITDCMEEGLTDPVKGINMATTAEIVAQIHGIPRKEQDEYAVESYRRAISAIEEGKYQGHIMHVLKDGEEALKDDENPLLREEFVLHPEKMANVPLLFDTPSFTIKNFYEKNKSELKGLKYQEGKTTGTLSLMNACPRSDGAAGIIVTTEATAKSLNLDIQAEVIGWAFAGIDPGIMGLAPAYSTEKALTSCGIKFTELELIELHEAFAATCLGIFKVGKESFGHAWYDYWKDARLNPNGGSISLGHPLAASGTRVTLSLIFEMRRRKVHLGMASACAAGGLGCSLILRAP